MRVSLYLLLWALGSAAVIGLLEPPIHDEVVTQPFHQSLAASAAPSPSDSPDLASVATEPPEALAAEPEGPSRLEVQAAVDDALRAVARAARAARGYADMDRGMVTVRDAGQRLELDPAEALVLADRVLEAPAEPLVDRALWLRGDALANLGDWEGAIEAWDAVGDTPVEDYLELRRLHALMELGRPSEAADRAELLVSELSGTNHQTIHLARELRVQALFAAARYDELLAEADDFLDIYREYPREDQLWHWMGQARLALGQPQRAVRHFDRVVWEYPYRPLAHGSWLALRALEAAGVDVPSHSFNERFERTERLLFNKHWDIVDAVLADLLRDLLEEQGETSFAGEIRLRQWRNAYGAGDFEAALGYLEALDAAGRPGVRASTYYTHLAETLARLGRFEEGADALRHRDRGRSTVRRHRELAEYYYENGFFEESLAHYREGLSERLQSGWDFSLLLFLAGEHDEARAHFESLADRATGTYWRRYRYWTGRAYQELGDYETARVVFEDVVDADSDSYYGLQSTNRLLEIERSEPPMLLVLADPSDGLGAPTAPLADPTAGVESPAGIPGEQVPHGDLHELAGSALQSLELHLSELVRRRVDEPAEPVASETTRFERPARLHWDGPDGVADTRFALVVSGHEIESAYYVPPDPDAFARLTESYGDLFPELERADFLHDVGSPHDARVESREATVELRGLLRAFQSRRPSRARPIRLSNRPFAHYVDNRSYDTGFWGIRLRDYRYPVPNDRAEREVLGERHIAIYDNRVELLDDTRQGLMTLGDYHFVRRFAQHRGGWTNLEPDGERRADWSEAFPRAYPELVTRWSDVYELNPYIIWALMRVETSFNPDSISRANARGLLQVIPKTGELISQRLGYWDFGPHNLMRPELSIEYGCYYFGELMEKFHGQELLAFAGYNGGPHNVSRWLHGRGNAPLDAFIETIPFEQAREYSKKVYRYVNLYRRIYLGEDHLYLGNVLDPEFELNIHF